MWDKEEPKRQGAKGMDGVIDQGGWGDKRVSHLPKMASSYPSKPSIKCMVPPIQFYYLNKALCDDVV